MCCYLTELMEYHLYITKATKALIYILWELQFTVPALKKTLSNETKKVLGER